MSQRLESKLKHAIVLIFVCLVLLSLSLSVVYADDEWWDDWLEEKESEAKEWWEGVEREAEEWWQETKEKGTKQWEETKEQTREEWREFQEESKETIGNVDTWLTQVREKTTSDIERAIEMTKEISGPYRREAWSIIEAEKRRQLCDEYNDPAKVGELERKRGFLTEGIIVAVKLFPVYDEEKGKIRTYDGLARDMVNQTPGLEGSDLAKDPVRTAALMLLDSDYLMYAKTIQTPNGRWISIREAQEFGYHTAEAVEAGSEYQKARLAYMAGDAPRVEKYMKKFASTVMQLNIEKDTSAMQFDPLWILPFGVIAIGGASYVIWEQENTLAKTATKRETSPAK